MGTARWAMNYRSNCTKIMHEKVPRQSLMNFINSSKKEKRNKD